MPIYFIIIICFITSILVTAIGKIKKNKKMLITGKCLILLLSIGLILFAIYKVEKNQEKQGELGQVGQNLTLQQPDRIIYKKTNGDYYIIQEGTKAYSKIYSELYNRTYNPIEGKVYSENEIAEFENKGSFVEFDYNTKSKNIVFMLEESEIGIIRRFTDSGQVIKTSLDDVKGLTAKLDSQTKEMTKYNFDKNNSYTSENALKELPTNVDIELKQSGIYQNNVYQTVIEYDENRYENLLKQLNFKSNNQLKDVDFEKENVIITISKYDINEIKQNIGNIKYKLGNTRSDYQVNVLIVSKVVNTNCIYLENASNEQNTSISDNTQINVTSSGIITSIKDNQIQIGYDSQIITANVNINSETSIKEYEKNSKIQFSDLNVGDLVYVEGETTDPNDNIQNIQAVNIKRSSKDTAKEEIQRYLKDTYRIDGMSIEYTNIDSDGKGYIIVLYSYDNFTYPIKLNVNNQTETFLGMGYHLQSNYGYVLHEMCDITLDTKITDVDNINGFVKTIEYIAD